MPGMPGVSIVAGGAGAPGVWRWGCGLSGWGCRGNYFVGGGDWGGLLCLWVHPFRRKRRGSVRGIL